MASRPLLLATLILLIAVTTALYSSNGPVIQLNNNNFKDKVMQSNHTWIVEFYAPWCGHCKQFAPEYRQAAKRTRGIINVGSVDCDVETELCQSVKIQGYPTIKVWYTNAKTSNRIKVDYNDERKTNKLVNFAYSRMPVFSKKIMATPQLGKSISLNEFYDIQNTTRPKAILFTKQKSTTTILKSLAISLQHQIVLGEINDSEETHIQEFGVTQFPTMKVIYTDKRIVEYEGPYDATKLRKWLVNIAKSDAALYKEDTPSVGHDETKKVTKEEL